MTHPLTAARWAVSSHQEHGAVLLADIHKIDRTCMAIGVIARMVGNSASEPDGAGRDSLDAWAVTSLLGGIESLCEYVSVLTEDMIDQASRPLASQHLESMPK